MTPDSPIYTAESDILAELFELAPPPEAAIPKAAAKSAGYFRDALAALRRDMTSMAALGVILLILLLALVGPGLNSFGFNDQNIDRVNMPPRIPALEKIGIADGSRTLYGRRADGLGDPEKYPTGSVLAVVNRYDSQGIAMADIIVDYYRLAGANEGEYYWFGTDYLGRDLMARLFSGARVSLAIAFISVASNVVIGIVYGAIAGYYGGKADMVMMRVAEIISAVPQLVMVTMLIMVMGAGFVPIIAALTLRGWTGTATLVRAQFYRLKGREYVLAARTAGVRDITLIFRHILPNAMGPIITRAMLAIPGAIFSEAFLAYIGLGIQAPQPSIGVMLSDGQRTLLHYPYQTFFPAMLISVLMICFTLLSHGLRDAFDPTARGGGA